MLEINLVAKAVVARSPVLRIRAIAHERGRILHIHCTERLPVPREPGQDPRHLDTMWPPWNLLDYAPERQGTERRPKPAYGA